jgi:hypothetical protein
MIKRSIYCLFIVLTCFFSRNALAQDLSLGPDNADWNEGKITLTNGTVLTGLIHYNTKTGFVKFDNGRESKAITARSATQFEYFDAVRNVGRKFYSIETEDLKGIKRPQFFEILKELKNFAVIYSQHPMELKQKEGWDSNYSVLFDNPNTGTRKIVASQSEVIYLIDTEGDINPYLIIMVEAKPRDYVKGTKVKTRNKIIGEKYFKELTGEFYSQLKAYAEQFDLEFADREDLLRILDHYEQLVAQRK